MSRKIQWGRGECVGKLTAPNPKAIADFPSDWLSAKEGSTKLSPHFISFHSTPLTSIQCAALF